MSYFLCIHSSIRGQGCQDQQADHGPSAGLRHASAMAQVLLRSAQDLKSKFLETDSKAVLSAFRCISALSDFRWLLSQVDATIHREAGVAERMRRMKIEAGFCRVVQQLSQIGCHGIGLDMASGSRTSYCAGVSGTRRSSQLSRYGFVEV